MIKIIDENDEFFWTYQDGTDTPPVFTLRRLSEKKRRELTREYTKKIYENGMLIEKIDEDGLHKALVEYIIKDWENICDKNGEPVKPTKETKWELPIVVMTQILLISQRPPVLDPADDKKKI